MNELCTFVQSKLLKELGFREKTYLYFEPNATWYTAFTPIQVNHNGFITEDRVSRPTVSHALDWLREAHKTHCVIDWHLTANYNLKWKFMADIITGGVAGRGNNFDTYSEAQSAALDAALAYIKDQQA